MGILGRKEVKVSKEQGLLERKGTFGDLLKVVIT